LAKLICWLDMYHGYRMRTFLLHPVCSVQPPQRTGARSFEMLVEQKAGVPAC
jgi:hypothetical protein